MSMPVIDDPQFEALAEAMVRAALGADRGAVAAGCNELLKGCYASKRPALLLSMNSLELPIASDRCQDELDQLLEKRKTEAERERTEQAKKEQHRERQKAGMQASKEARHAAGATTPRPGPQADPVRPTRPSEAGKPAGTSERTGNQDTLFSGH
jgi:hypothetical protein